MVNKHMAREIVLPRFEGKTLLKEALQYSDFGTPDLFGPLSAEMADNVRMYRVHNNKEWRMTTRKSGASSKRKASSSLSSPSIKRSLASSSTPLSSSSFNAAPSHQGSQPQYSKSVFQNARGKRGKKRGRGRGGRGK